MVKPVAKPIKTNCKTNRIFSCNQSHARWYHSQYAFYVDETTHSVPLVQPITDHSYNHSHTTRKTNRTITTYHSHDHSYTHSQHHSQNQSRNHSQFRGGGARTITLISYLSSPKYLFLVERWWCIIPKWYKNDPKVIYKWPQNDPQITLTWP